MVVWLFFFVWRLIQDDSAWFNMTQCSILLAKFLRMEWCQIPSNFSWSTKQLHVVPGRVFHSLRVGRNQFARTQPITWKWRHCFFQGPVEALQAGSWDKWTAAQKTKAKGPHSFGKAKNLLFRRIFQLMHPNMGYLVHIVYRYTVYPQNGCFNEDQDDQRVE